MAATETRQPSLPFDLVPALSTPAPSVLAPSALPLPALPTPTSPRRIRVESASPEPIFARHPKARRYVLRVLADGTVRVTIPRWGSKREASAFAAGQMSWIEKQRRRLEDERRRPKPAPRDPAIERALFERARRDLPPRLLELAPREGLQVARISVRNQRRRWGSCSRAGHICLNWRLVEMPEAVRDYVLIHELMHLRRMDHSAAFWKLVAEACPDYEACRRWLRRHADAPHVSE